MFCFVSVDFFNDISTFVDYFSPNAIFLEEQQWYYLTHDKRLEGSLPWVRK